jgi:uncharacterized phage protein gp47/JayE
MAFSRPTLEELVDRIENDFVSRLALSGALLRRSMARVLARVLAGASHLLHGHIEWVSRQIFADTAEAEFLKRIGRLFGVDANEATFATGNVTITGSNGTTIPAETVLVRSDGAEYEVDADVTIASGTATAALTALVAGQDGNCDEDTELSFASPVSGADSTATVASGGLSGGTDEEADEDYRERVLERLREPPQGGSESDYEAWAKEVAGVTRVWVYPQENGAGTVVVRFARDDDASPIPDSGEVDTVQDYIDARRPVTATVTVEAPTAAPLNFTIAVVPNTTAVKDAVEAELEDLLSREAEPGETLPISKIRTAIGSAEGLEDYTLTIPAADVTHTTGQLATMGTITWV